MNDLDVTLRLALAAFLLCGTGSCGDDSEDSPDLSMPADSGGDAEPEVDSGPAPCSMEGATRLSECGNCGMGQEVCEGGAWVLEACLNEGECSPGALQREDLAMCASRARLCGESCEWGPWDDEAAAGECEAGTERVVESDACDVGEALRQTCNDSCRWDDAGGSCVSPCGSLRESPWYAEEVCVPEGAFIRGDDDITEIDTPEVEIVLSTFAIDRYPVTVERYKACVDAGACTEGPGFRSSEYYDDPARQDHVMDVSRAGAVAFCAWDGGRLLPTDAQWQKALRGPAPRRNQWSAGPDDYDCGLRTLSDCPGANQCGPFVAVGDIVADESYYGVREPVLSTNGQHARDAFAEDWWTSAASRVRDPFNDPTMVEGEWDGMVHGACNTSFPLSRVGALEDVFTGAFRCVREGL